MEWLARRAPRDQRADRDPLRPRSLRPSCSEWGCVSRIVSRFPCNVGRKMERVRARETRPELRATTGHGDASFVRVTLHSHEPCERSALAAALDDLPGTVVRFKGLVRVQDCPEQPYVLQGVGRRWSLEPAPPQVSAALGIDEGSAIDVSGCRPGASHPIRATETECDSAVTRTNRPFLMPGRDQESMPTNSASARFTARMPVSLRRPNARPTRRGRAERI